MSFRSAVTSAFAPASSSSYNSDVEVPPFVGLLDLYGGASGAFSTASLTADNLKVMRVRRTSDNSELDFFGKAVSDNTMLNWVNEIQTSRINFASGSNDFTSYDNASDSIVRLGNFGTWSLRQAYNHTTDPDNIGPSPTIDSDYSFKFSSQDSLGYNKAHGLKIETKEDGTVPYNITFKYFIPEGQPSIQCLYSSTIAGSLSVRGQWTEVTVRNTAFIANGILFRSQAYTSTGGLFYLADIRITVDTVHGYVTNWYDQSGNNKHLTQSVAASQPRIVSSGALVVKNRKPSIDFLTSERFFTCSIPLTKQEMSIFAFVQISANTDSGDILRNRCILSVGNSFFLGGPNSSNQFGFTYGVNRTFSMDNSLKTSLQLHSFFGTTSGARYFTNGNNLYTDSAPQSNSTLSNFYVGKKQYTAGHNLRGYMSDLIFYDSDQSGNRIAIEAQLNSKY